MKRIIFVWLLLCTNSILFAQNDATNDSWQSTSGIVSTNESVLVSKYITFSGADAPRGIKRNGNALSLDLWGGSTLENGASISISGGLRGGADNQYNGRMQFFTGGASMSSQSDIKGNFDFATRWNGGEKSLLTLDSSTGHLGLGTTNPTSLFQIVGPTSGYVPGQRGIRVDGNFNSYVASFINTSGGNGAGGLLVETTDGNGIANAMKVVTYRSNGSNTVFRIPNAGGFPTPRVLLAESGGRVGIGVTEPANALDVCGIIRSNEVIVEEGWCDFVFEENYKLPSLTEQKNFIKQNGHLKNFQSEEEMNGEIQVGDISKRQQQSIEEMMLYLIKMEERMTSLETENAKLKAELKVMRGE